MSKEVPLKDLLQELAEQRGFDFRGYKKTTLERRFRKRMFQLNIGTYAEYGAFIRSNPDEAGELLNTILINVTEFLRDPPAWEVLRNEILPPMLKPLEAGASFRTWSAGCASGEEAYSIAIILSEFFGPRIAQYDVKIYATDIDDDALATARRGEYSAEALRRMRPELRAKYFHGKGMLRVNHEVRRLVIFGRSNLGHDAPISHVDLLICRNVLIYFDPELQRQTLARLHYALEPGGILFLGKSEPQLSNSTQFRRLNARWRIFQRITPTPAGDVLGDSVVKVGDGEKSLSDEVRQELASLRSQHRDMLETLRLGVLVLGMDDTIVQHNTAMLALYGLTPVSLTGKRLQDTFLFTRMSDLATHLQASRVDNQTVSFQSRIKVAGEEHLLEATLRPVMDDDGARSGTLIYCEEVTVQEKLQTTIEELESTSEELQSANEELETTNEELQSTNEELETTNEELQSTNEELETTNEELQSLNEELETNQELEDRGNPHQIDSRYTHTLEKIGLPVMVVNGERRIEFCNRMALRLFGFKSKPPIGFHLEQLPLAEALRSLILRRTRSTRLKQKPAVVRDVALPGRLSPLVDVHFSYVEREGAANDVLIMFEPRPFLRRPKPEKPRKAVKKSRKK